MGSFCKATKADVGQHCGCCPGPLSPPHSAGIDGGVQGACPTLGLLGGTQGRSPPVPVSQRWRDAAQGVQSCTALCIWGFLQPIFASHQVRGPARVQCCHFLPPAPCGDRSMGTMGSWGQREHRDNGSTGTMGARGQAQATAVLRHCPARTSTPLAQPRLSHLLPAPLPVRSSHLSWHFGGSENPQGRGGPICTQARGPRLVSASLGGSL